MKKMAIILICLCLFWPSFAQEKKFGFTGEFRQYTLKVFPPFLSTRGFETIEEEDDAHTFAKRKVNALMIGLTNFDKPDNPEWEIYDFYAYYWPGYHEWWVGIVVVNYDSITAPCKIIMQINGPQKSKITRKAILQPDEAVVFSAKVNLANKAGLYTLIGKITGTDIGSGKLVKTRCYIYEIW